MVKGELWLKRNSAGIGIVRDNVNPATVDLSLGGEIVEIPKPFSTYKQERSAFQVASTLSVYREHMPSSKMYALFPDEWKSMGILNDAVVYNIPDGESFTFIPSAFYLAATKESVKIPQNMVASGDLKSTTARLSINHLAALLIDPGYTGNITLELTTILPVSFTIGERIIQLTFHEVDEGGVYSGRYQKSAGVVPAIVRAGRLDASDGQKAQGNASQW